MRNRIKGDFVKRRFMRQQLKFKNIWRFKLK